MLSFWEKQSFVQYDYLVIGGGIVGLSTAISLKDKVPGARILVLERGIFPSGASTKNAGFACFGSLTELVSDIGSMGEAAVLSLVEERWKGLLMLRKRLGDAAVGYRSYGGYELIGRDQLTCLQHVGRINGLLHPLFGENVFSEDKSAVRRFGFNPRQVESVLFNRFEGQVDTGKMMKNLIAKAASLNITMITGAEVLGFDEGEKEVSVKVKNTALPGDIVFTGRGLAICTNAFTQRLLPGLDISPGRGTVLVTAPIHGLRFKGVFHFEEGYYYFRNVGNRVLFGGGRNLDVKTETTTTFGLNEMIYNDLLEKLHHMILPGQSVNVESCWTGIMAFGNSKVPILEKHSPRVGIGVRLGGMGVAIGTRMGDRLAGLLTEK